VGIRISAYCMFLTDMRLALTYQESQLADVDSKHQETQRKITELQSTMSSMARPPVERVILPTASGDFAIAE
jgi:hypothetical protein